MTSTPLPHSEIREMPSELWRLPYQPVGCRACGQAFLAPAGWSGRACPHCFQGTLEPQPARLRPEPPELVMPFQRRPSDLTPALQAFTRGVWLAPGDFTAAHLKERMVPYFWPKWLVDGTVAGTWQAELGFDYQVGSSQESYQAGRWQSREVIETRVRWEPRLGEIERRYQNLAAPGISAEAGWLARTGGSPLDLAQPYDPELLRGAGLRIPDLSPDETWPLAQAAFDRAAAEDCQRAGCGQHLRGFKAQVRYEGLNWTQLLLPVYATYYTDDQGKPVCVWINGATGQIGGPRLSSPRKGLRWAGVSLLMALALFVLALLSYALTPQAPGLAALSPVFWLLGFLAAGLAAVPAAWPLIWNRSQVNTPCSRGCAASSGLP